MPEESQDFASSNPFLAAVGQGPAVVRQGDQPAVETVLQKTFQALGTPLLRLSAKGVIADVNAAGCQFLGLSRDRLIGQPLHDFCATQGTACTCTLTPPLGAFKQGQIALQTGAETPQLTTFFLIPNGDTTTYTLILQPLSGVPPQVVTPAIAAEAPALQAALAALRDRDRQLDLLFSQSLDGFFFMMLDEPIRWDDTVNKAATLDYVFSHQRMTRANQALLQQYGLSEAEFLGLTPADFFAHDLAAGRVLWQQFFDAGRLHVNTQECKADGTPIWIEGDYICLYDDAGCITGHFGVQREVTGLRMAIAALADSEANYRMLVEHQTDLVVKVDPDGHFLFVSPSYCELFGRSAEELLNHHFIPFVHEGDRAATEQAMATLWQPPHTCQVEQRALTRHGWRWLAWSDKAILDDDGNVTAIVGVGRDITERKQMELALQLSERRFRTVLETLNLAAIMLDRHGNLIFCNDHLLQLTGWQRAEVLHRNWAELFLPPEVRPVVRDLTERLITEPDVPTYNENEIVTRHGDRRLIAWNNSVQRDADGVAISITSIGEDITARKRYEASIYELTHRLALATGAAKLGIWDWDVVNDILLWDERMYEIYGIDPAAFDGTFQAWLSRVHPEDRPIVAAAEFEAIQTQTSEVHHEYRILRPDGQVRHIEKHAVILRDEQGRGQRILGINCDISDRKQAETTLKALTERLSVATEAAQLGVWDWDVVGQRVVWDERMYAIYGLDAATWTPTFEAWQTLVHPDDLPPLLTTIDAAFRQGLPHYHQEFRVLRQDGQVCSVECHANILRDEAGQPRRVIGVNWDISDRKQAETALQATTERLYLATAAAQLGVWEWDIASDRLTWDERMHIIYGQPLGSFGGTYGAWQAQVHPDDWPTVEATAAQFLAADSTYSTEFRIICPNGDIRHVESYAHMVRDPAGQPQRVIGINRDISHRKQADLALAEAHQQVQALLQNAPTIIGLFDETGRYHQVNSSIARLLDRPPAEIVGRRFDELYPPEVAAVFMARLQEVVATNAPLTVEDRLSLAEEEVILRAVLFPVLNQPGRPKLLGVVAIDITAPIRAQESLQRQAERERLIREITANIRRSLDLDVILESTVGEVRRFLNTDRVLVYRFNPDWSGVAIVESVGAGWTAVLHRTLHDDCFGQDLIERYLSGYISQIDDVQTAPIHDCHRDFLNQFEIRANLVLPLVIEGNLWGLLCIHHCREPRRWLPDEVGFTNQIADQVEIAIQQSQLLQATAIQAQRERLRSLITEHIRDSLDLSSILNTTVEEIRQFLKTDRVLVYRFHPDWSGQVIVESVEPGWTAALHAQLHDPCFQGNLVGQYRRGAVSQMANIATAELSPCYRNFLKQFEIQANLVLPLLIEGDLWGLLCIHHCRTPRPWQADEIAFVKQICDQVAIAIQQAQLLEQTTLRAQREKVLNEIVMSIRDSLELQEILERVTQKLLQVFAVGRCNVTFCTEDGAYLEVRASAASANMTSIQGYYISLQDHPYVREVLAQEMPQAIHDVTADVDAPTAAWLVAEMGIRAKLDVAIRYRGTVKGILCVHHPEPRQWTENEQILIKQVADQLAIALQQAELYQQAQAEIAERQRLEEQLRHDAFHDSLTGLPNRALFLDRLQFALQRYQRWHRPEINVPDGSPRDEFAILFLDLDRFKVINDSLGHSFGDQLLKLVASRLTNCLREVDIAARLGGDEFVVLLEELADQQFAIEVARRIHTVLEVPIFLDEREIYIRASIGIAFGSRHYSDPGQILRDADIAMYQAKHNDQEYVVFDASMHTIALQQMNLENDLRHAIKREEFRLHYQPIVSLSTGKIISFEALVRWQHPTRGLLYPMAFIEVAEETGLIAAIDLWVLQEACLQLQQWHTQSPEFANLSISVNLSGKQFSQPDLIDQIDYALASAGLAGKYLKLEVTESVLIENNALAVQTLNAFRSRNIQVCMDDFGTGYSSLSYLHQFPVDILKIDKSFILNLNFHQVTSRDYEIVKAIINLALNLNLEVVAEGIENRDVLAYLRQNKCQLGQGHFFSPAVDREGATQLLLTQPFQSEGRQPEGTV